MGISIEYGKVQFFRKTILSWFDKEGRPFPWRTGECDSYRIVVGEILLQRTRAEVVSKYYPSFISRFPSWYRLASTPISELEEFLKPLGLWKRRAKAFNSLSNVVVMRGGKFPATRHELESLPSIGQYIANAVLTICYGKKEPLLDVNMSRVLERFFGPRKLVDIRYDPYLQNLSREILTSRQAREINWAILDFAALVCTARNPSHASCPLATKCDFYSRTKSQT
ncbi:HhH-GPD family protein [Dehalococcoides mccartyi]|uniref:hypothetical protein n=1 Tax=Dehalococcoides mccartyi TaxID=61435 RepID=UPI000A4E73C6|nr:hypothetical protein [Dehalococcoides mccartyi]